MSATLSQNPLKLKRVHHIEFWVGNARQAAFFYRKGFGFSQAAYRGLETGERQLTSYVLSQGKANFMFTSPLEPEHPASEHIRKHGDGVKDVALHVEDAEEAFKEAVRRGAQPAEEPHEVRDEHGTICRAALHTYGDTIHSLISYRDYNGPFLPGFVAAPIAGEDAGILRIDHVVGNVDLGKMDVWAEFYHHVLGFHRYITFDDKDISTDYSALMSIVMSDDSQSIKFPMNEPATGKREEPDRRIPRRLQRSWCAAHRIAMRDEIETVVELRDNGIEFLRVPDSYYDMLRERVGKIDEPLEAIRSNWESWWIATKKATCCRFSANRSKIVQRSSSRSFSARAAAALAKAISRHCSSR